MEKIGLDFVIKQYQSGIDSYVYCTTDVGLWDSERYVFDKYLNQADNILDLGCGTGRTTFGLKKLGYNNIVGVDLTPEMIEAAQKLNAYFKEHLDFKVGDAMNLDFKDCLFESVIFSFNGLMSIPNGQNRLMALKEINRVLKPDGVFIFTTHDRAADPNYLDYWKEQEQNWKDGKRRDDLHEFGDVITTSRNEAGEIFIHIPGKEEVMRFIDEGGFRLLETFYREEKFDEPQKVKEKSGECRFWVVEKV